MSDELESKMLSLFTLGSSYLQIADYIEDMYGVHYSKAAIAAIPDKLLPNSTEKIKPWATSAAPHKVVLSRRVRIMSSFFILYPVYLLH